MRDIKFRGKASHNGEWLYGDLINIHGRYHILGEDDMREDGHHVTQDSDRPTWVEPGTISQFTGLYDKSDKEIYEGDVVKFGMDKELIGIVEYDRVNPCFCITYKTIYGTTDWEYDFVKAGKMRIEVIGNIYDNPELIKYYDTNN